MRPMLKTASNTFSFPKKNRNRNFLNDSANNNVDNIHVEIGSINHGKTELVLYPRKNNKNRSQFSRAKKTDSSEHDSIRSSSHNLKQSSRNRTNSSNMYSKTGFNMGRNYDILKTDPFAQTYGEFPNTKNLTLNSFYSKASKIFYTDERFKT